MRIKKKHFLMLSLLTASLYAQSGTVSYPIYQDDITVSSENGIALFAGGTFSGPSGTPALARKQMTFLMAEDADLSSISLSLNNAQLVTLPGVYDVAAIAPVMMDTSALWPDGADIINGKDMNVYSKNAFYPQDPIKIISVGTMWKYKLVTVEVSPYRYNPVTKQLARYDTGFYTVGSAPSAAPMASLPSAAPVSQSFAARMYSQVSEIAENKQPYNREPAAAFTAEASVSNRNKYVIITTNATASASQKLSSFVSCKEAQGFDVDVVTENIWGGGTGDAAAENIRAWLKNHYVSDNIEYVLLVGNPHPSDGDVPMKMSWPRKNATHNLEYTDSPTDFYYSELSGNWDIDGDGFYGEYRDDYNKPGGADTYAELSVGRIPVYNNDIAAMDEILNKSIAYTNSANVNWRSNVLLPMVPSDNLTPGYQLGESVRTDILIPNNYASYRIYQEDYGVSPELFPINVTNVVNTWKANPYGFALWWTHGSASSASGIISSAYTSELNDSYPAITFQVSCENAYPENSNNLAYSILNNGGIATVAATRVSWYYRGETSFTNTYTNAGMGYRFSQNLIAEKQSVGHSLSNVKASLTPYGSAFWMNWTVFGIYGDPSLKIGTDVQMCAIESSVRGSEIPYSEWHADSTYSMGDTVFCADTVWTAKWWSRNELPGENMGPNKPWSFVKRALHGGGEIAPLGTTFVNKGGSQEYTIIPDPGVTQWTVFIDGSPIGRELNYTFTDLQENHAIEVDFSTTYSGAFWIADKIYTSGDKVRYGNKVWEAKWWCSGVVPSEVNLWGPWKLIQ